MPGGYRVKATVARTTCLAWQTSIPREVVQQLGKTAIRTDMPYICRFDYRKQTTFLAVHYREATCRLVKLSNFTAVLINYCNSS